MPEASEWEGDDLEEEEEDTQSETEVPLYRTQTPEELTEEEMIQEEMDDEFEAGTLHLEDLEAIVAEVDVITQDLLGEFPEDAFAFELEEEEIDITIDEATDDVMLAGVGDHFQQSVDDVIAGELTGPELTEDLPEDIVILKLDEDQVDVLVYDDVSTDSVNTTESQEPTQQLTLEVKEEQEEVEKITESKSVVEVLESAGKPVLDAELEHEEVAAQDQYLEELEDVFARLLEELKAGLEEEDLTIEISVEPASEQQDQEEISLHDEKDSVQEEVSDAASLAAQDSDTIDQVELGFSEYELFQLERQYLAERLTTKEELEKIEEERITDQNANIEEEYSGQEEGMVPSSETETDSWGDHNQELNPEILDETLAEIEAKFEALADHSEQHAGSFEDNIDLFSSDISISDSFTFGIPNDAENQTIDAEPTLGYSSLTSLTELPLWGQYVQDLRVSPFINEARSQIEEETLSHLAIEADNHLKTHEDTVQLHHQGPTIPEPPPYDFLAELEAWEEEEAQRVKFYTRPPIYRFTSHTQARHRKLVVQQKKGEKKKIGTLEAKTKAQEESKIRYNERKILATRIKTIQSELQRQKSNSTFYQRFPDSIKRNEERIQNFRVSASRQTKQSMENWIRTTLNHFLEREGTKVKCLWPDCTTENSRNHPDRLRAHIGKHLGISSGFQCPHCALEISDQGNLKRHIKRKHPVKLNQTRKTEKTKSKFFEQIDVKRAIRLWDNIIGINYDRFCKQYTQYLSKHDLFKDAREIIADARLSVKSGSDRITIIPDVTIYHQDYHLSFLDFKRTLHAIWIKPETLNYIIEHYPTSTLVLCFMTNDYSTSQIFMKAARTTIRKVLIRQGISSTRIPQILNRIKIWLVEEDFAQLIPIGQRDQFFHELQNIKSMTVTSHDIVTNVRSYLTDLKEKTLESFESNFPNLDKGIITQDIETILNTKFSLYIKITSLVILEDLIKSKYLTSDQVSKKFRFQSRIANQYLVRLRKLGILRQAKYYRNYLSFYKHTPEPSISQIMHHISPIAKLGYQELIKRKFMTKKELDKKLKSEEKRFFGSIVIYGLILEKGLKVFLPREIQSLVNENIDRQSILVKMTEGTVKSKLAMLTPILALRIIAGKKNRSEGRAGHKYYYYVPSEVSFIEALSVARPEEAESLNYLIEKDVLDKEKIDEEYMRKTLGKGWHRPLIVLNLILQSRKDRYLKFNDIRKHINLSDSNIRNALQILNELSIVKVVPDSTYKYGRIKMV